MAVHKKRKKLPSSLVGREILNRLDSRAGEEASLFLRRQGDFESTRFNGGRKASLFLR